MFKQSAVAWWVRAVVPESGGPAVGCVRSLHSPTLRPSHCMSPTLSSGNTFTHTLTSTFTHVYSHTNSHTFITHMHFLTCIHSFIHIQIYSHLLTTLSHTYIYSHLLTHSYSVTHTRSHTQPLPGLPETPLAAWAAVESGSLPGLLGKWG